MDFTLSEEQQMLRDMVRRIKKGEFAPKAAEIDRINALSSPTSC